MNNKKNLAKLFEDREEITKVQLNTCNIRYETVLADHCASIFSINNFEKFLNNADDFEISSSLFNMEKNKDLGFWLDLKHKKDSNYLRLKLHFIHVSQKFNGSYTLWLIDKNHEKVQLYYREIHCEKGSFQAFETEQFLELSKLKKPNNKWLTDGTLNIFVIMHVAYIDKVVRAISNDKTLRLRHAELVPQNQKEVLDKKNKVNKPLVNKNEEVFVNKNQVNQRSVHRNTSSNYLEKMYNNGILCDLIITVDNKELKVHKNVLATASSIFLEIF